MGDDIDRSNLILTNIQYILIYDYFYFDEKESRSPRACHRRITELRLNVGILIESKLQQAKLVSNVMAGTTIYACGSNTMAPLSLA